MTRTKAEQVCAVEDCERTDLQGYGWCRMHYYRWRRHGDPLVVQVNRSLPGAVCLIADCDRTDIRGHGWCTTHYTRWRATGDAEYIPSRRGPGTSLPEICEVDGCEKPTKRKARMCSMHVARVARHGDPHKVIAWADRQFPAGSDHQSWLPPERMTYFAAHSRLRTQRGRAAEHVCACGTQAAQWSYDRQDPDEMQSDLGPYSADINHYVPLCVSCHKRFDLKALGKLVSW